VHELIDLTTSDFFSFDNLGLTREHSNKLVKHGLMYVPTFLQTELNVWNSLPEDIVSAPTLRAFRGRLCNLDLSVYCVGKFD